MSENLVIDFYVPIFPDTDQEFEVTDEWIANFKDFFKKIGFQFVRTELERNCQKILKPITAFLDFDAKMITRSFLSDILEDTESFVGMSTENGVLIVNMRIARSRVTKGGRVVRMTRTRKLYLTHVRTTEQKTLTEISKQFFEAKKMAIVSEKKGEYREGLNKRLSNFSPSGKLLSKKENRKKALALSDPTTMAIVSKINEKDGGVAYSNDVQKIGKQLRLDEKKLESLIGALLEKKLLNRLLQIVCHKCGAPNLRAEASADINKLLKKIRCGVCNEEFEASDVQEVFVLPKDVISLAKGIWLEEHVRNVAKNCCSEVWQGRFLGNDELDVVGLKLGSIFLFECKTTDVGHTDVYNLVIKARRLGADASYLITTAKVVENAKKAVEELSRTEGMKIYSVEGDAESIRKSLLKHIQHEINDKLKQLVLESMGVSSYRYRRAFFRGREL